MIPRLIRWKQPSFKQTSETVSAKHTITQIITQWVPGSWPTPIGDYVKAQWGNDAWQNEHVLDDVNLKMSKATLQHSEPADRGLHMTARQRAQPVVKLPDPTTSSCHLDAPRRRLTTYGSRSFICAAARWNYRPDSLKVTALSQSCFQNHLNTFHFSSLTHSERQGSLSDATLHKSHFAYLLTTPESDDCALLTLEHWPSVALRVLSATEHSLPRHHGYGTVCHLSCGNPNCHMDNLGVHLRHFYLGSRVTGAVWPLLTAPYKNTYLLTYLPAYYQFWQWGRFLRHELVSSSRHLHRALTNDSQTGLGHARLV